MPCRLFRSWYLSLILPFILILGLWFLISEGNLYQSSYSGKWYGARLLWLTSGSEVRQDFVANYPGLDQIDIFVKDLNLADTAEITFQLRQNCQAKSDLRRQVALQPRGKIEGQTFYSFTFEPLEESTDQKYCFILTANTTASDEQVIGVLTGEGDVYPSGQAYYQEPLFGKKTDKLQNTPSQINSEGKIQLFLPIIQAELPNSLNLDVAFQLHYQGAYVQTSQVFFDRLVKYKPHVWGRSEFYILLFVTYIFGATIFIRFVIRQVN